MSLHGNIHLLLFISQTVVTHIADVDDIVLTEIVEQGNASANFRLRIPQQCVKVDVGHPLFMGVFLLKERLDAMKVVATLVVMLGLILLRLGS